MITSNKSTLVLEEQAFDGDGYVADYLRDTPDFFARNPHLLLELEVPHHQRGAVSLVEKRQSLQREQFAELQNRLAEIVEVAHQNDHLSELLHDYSMGLMSAGSLAEVFTFTRTVLIKRLRCQLSTAVILQNDVIDLCSDGLSDYVKLADAKECSSMRDLHSRRSVYCGYPISNRVEQFFPQEASEIKSIAIIRLANTTTSVQPIVSSDEGSAELTRMPDEKITEFGYLALASTDRERFAPHMGTDFLARFGALLSARLAVFY